jgi:L-iditol 2-dehydrogenase
LHAARDVRLAAKATPLPGPGEELLDVLAVGLCGSDRHWYEDGAIGEVRLAEPVVLGHEIVARIAAGPRRGERVAVDPADPCGTCDICRSGRGRLCPAVRFAGHAPDDGGLLTQMAWPSDRLHPLPESIGDAEGTLLEVLGIALHALDLAGLPAEGSSREPGRPDAASAQRSGLRAGVYGAGPVGLMLVAALRAAGIDQIVASDPLGHRLDAARIAGATEVVRVTGTPDPAADLAVDVAFECAGEDAAFDTAVRAVRPGGRVVLVGIPATERSAFPAAVARRKELSLHLCRRMEASDLPRAIGLVAAGRVDVRPFVSHRFALDEASEAFRVLADRSGLKVVVEPQREARA